MATAFPTPDFADYPERSIVALARNFTKNTRSEIPALWQELWSREFNVANLVEGAAFGVSFDQTGDGGFRYGVGFESSSPQDLPDGACIITLAAGPYVVFRKRAPVTELPPLFDAIFNEWLPASDWQMRRGAVFERYPDDPAPESGAMLFEIWVPVSAA